MPVQYTPLTQLELDVIGALAGFSAPTWNGPALPRPEGTEGLDEFLDTVGKLIARAEYLIQAKDALSITYTINNITATAERFLLGTEEQVQQAADLRGLLTLVEKFLNSIFPAYATRIADGAGYFTSQSGSADDAGRDRLRHSVRIGRYGSGDSCYRPEQHCAHRRGLFGIYAGRSEPVCHDVDNLRGHVPQGLSAGGGV